jgi:hypothetical protein
VIHEVVVVLFSVTRHKTDCSSYMLHFYVHHNSYLIYCSAAWDPVSQLAEEEVTATAYIQQEEERVGTVLDNLLEFYQSQKVENMLSF